MNWNQSINQNIVVWTIGMIALFVCSYYGASCWFFVLGAIVSIVATWSVVVCLVAYTLNYLNKKQRVISKVS